MKYIQYPVGTRHCRVPTKTMYLTYLKSAVRVRVKFGFWARDSVKQGLVRDLEKEWIGRIF